MARTPNATDFSVDVEGVGRFIFGRRKMADEMKIHVEYARMTEAVEPTPWLDSVATWLATLKVMTVMAPADFALDDLDPLDDEVYAKLMRTCLALAEKERSFRRKPNEESQAGGAPAK